MDSSANCSSKTETFKYMLYNEYIQKVVLEYKKAYIVGVPKPPARS